MTKTILFVIANQTLYLVYEPEQISVSQLVNKLIQDEHLTVKKVFSFKEKDKVSQTPQNQLQHDEEAEIAFVFAHLKNGLWCIEGRVLGIDYDVFITTDLSLKPAHFIAYRDISILENLPKWLSKTSIF